jgi:SAM-dependent methyltransferase
MNTMTALVADKTYWPQDLWDECNSDVRWHEAGERDIVRQFIESRIPRSNGDSCIELGCMPGRYLSCFGRMGYTLSGVDLSPNVKTELPGWLSSMDYRIGDFAVEDVRAFTAEEKFSVVCSFGLIEHFENWAGIVSKHVELCKPGGYVIITAPNFRGWCQKLMHQLADPENLSYHNLDAMQPNKWAALGSDMECDVLFSGYLGRFDFWSGPQRRTWVRKGLGSMFKTLGKLPKMVPLNTVAMSPYCAVVLQKRV